MMGRTVLHLTRLDGLYCVARLDADAACPAIPPQAELFAVTRTAEEVSVVCPEEAAPAGAAVETGFCAFRVMGALDFALTGIIARLTAPLAAAAIPVFALSTFDTDCLLIREHDVAAARRAWAKADIVIAGDGA